MGFRETSVPLGPRGLPGQPVQRVLPGRQATLGLRVRLALRPQQEQRGQRDQRVPLVPGLTGPLVLPATLGLPGLPEAPAQQAQTQRLLVQLEILGTPETPGQQVQRGPEKQGRPGRLAPPGTLGIRAIPAQLVLPVRRLRSLGLLDQQGLLVPTLMLPDRPETRAIREMRGPRVQRGQRERIPR